jgi:hypothetical protein
MSYFIDLDNTNVDMLWQFQAPGVGIQNAIRCNGGEIAAWEYSHTDEDGNYLVKIYDATTGTPVYKTLVYVIPGRDIFCGLFSSGAIPSGDIFDSGTVYYRVDYV